MRASVARAPPTKDEHGAVRPTHHLLVRGLAAFLARIWLRIRGRPELDRHVEGGFFRRTYASDYRLQTPTASDRSSMTSIFYLLATPSPIGHFHINRSDIVHYFHLGDPISYYLIHPDGNLEIVVMGNNLRAGQQLQMTVPGGVWKASQIPADGEHGFGLVSEAVSPGFDYTDMTLGYCDELLKLFPQYEELIRRLSHADRP